MKGKATFTLTDARTGKVVKQVTEHNMVTDAAKRILNPPAYLLANKFSYSDFLKSVLPLYAQVFGGIVLLGNELEERADNITPGRDCQFIASAGSAYAGTNVCRGTLNQNESYATENGYHFTWDFGTDKANGTIKCAALTSRSFGDSGLNAADKSSYFIMEPTDMGGSGSLVSQATKAIGQYIGTFQKNVLTYCKFDQYSSTLDFVRIRCIDPYAVKITDRTGISSCQEPIFSKTLEMPFGVPVTTHRYYDPDKKLMFFFSTVNSSNGVDSVKYAGVSMEDFTIKEQGEYALSGSYYNIYGAAFYDGKFFIGSNKGMEIYSAPGVIAETPFTEYSSGSYFYNMNGLLLYYYSMNNTYLYLNGGFFSLYSSCNMMPQPSIDVRLPYIMMCGVDGLCSKDSASVNPYLGLISTYFATINNLGEPIVKTNEHALKITYDITN